MRLLLFFCHLIVFILVLEYSALEKFAKGCENCADDHGDRQSTAASLVGGPVLRSG